MLYDAYKNKMKKLAKVKHWMFKFRALLISALLLCVAALTTFLCTKGIVTQNVALAANQFVYGDEVQITQAKALFSKIKRYEYAEKSSEEWSQQKPTKAGEYKVRAVTSGSFGEKYGESVAFSIAPRQTVFTVKPDQEDVVYGNTPDYEIDLLSGDYAVDNALRFTYDRYVCNEPVGIELKLSSLTIRNRAGDDVTDCYSVTTQKENITLAPKPITLVPQNASTVYNGKAQPYPNTVTPQMQALLVDEDALSFTSSTYRIADGIAEIPVNAQQYAVQIDSVTVTKNGVDVTQMYTYNVAAHTATYTVQKCPITVQTDSASKIYDGVTLSAHSFTSNGLPDGHRVQAVENTFAALIDAGSIANRCDFIVTKDGDDVSDNFDVRVNFGTLTVNKRPVTVATDDANKVYDGNELTCNAFDVTSTDANSGLVNGDSLTILNQVSITDVGTLANNLQFAVSATDYTDNTHNYDITVAAGTLTVTKRKIGVRTATDTWEYDGDEHFNVTLAYSGESGYYGLVSTHTATVQSGYTTVRNATTTAQVNILSVKIYDDYGSEKTGNYDIVYDYGTLSVEPRALIVVADSYEWVYDGKEHSMPTGTADRLVGDDECRVDDPTKWITIRNVGTADNSYTIGDYEIFSADGKNVSSNYRITMTGLGYLKVTARGITITTASATKEYDGTPLSAAMPNAEDVDGLAQGHKLIPIESTVTSITKCEDSGKKNEVEYTIADADGNDVTGNYQDITYHPGTLTVTLRELKITTASATKVYDGKPLSACEGYSADRLATGHSLQHVSTEKLEFGPDVGTLNQGNIYAFTIVDGSGNDVTKNYHVGYYYGTLTITKRPVTIVTADAQKVYDGNELRTTEWSIAEKAGDPDYGLLQNLGHTLQATRVVQITYVSETESGNNTTQFRIIDTNNGDADVTANYDVDYIYGTLTVTKRPVCVVTASDTWEFDGELHYNTDFTLNTDAPYDSIANTDSVKTVDDSYATVWGVTTGEENRLRVMMYRENIAYSDMTDNYDITYRYGTLTVTPRLILIVTASDEKVYDDEPLYKVEPLYIWHILEQEGKYVRDTQAAAFVNAHEWMYIGDIVSITEVGSVDNIYSYTIVNNNSNVDGFGDVTENYDIRYTLTVDDVDYTYGTLTVTKRPISVKTNTDAFEFDGTDHSSLGFTLYMSLYSLVGGHTYKAIDYTTVCYVTDGVKENIFTVTIYRDETEVTENYDISYIYGTLTVYPRNIVVVTASDEKEYDGTALVNDTPEKVLHLGHDAVDSNALVLSHTLVPISVASITDAGSIDNVCNYAVMDGTVDRSLNYTIVYEVRAFGVDYTYGTLTVTPRTILVTTGSDEKEYDGTSLSMLTISASHLPPISADPALVLDHEIKPLGDAAAITNVWETEEHNNVRKVQIVDGENNDVTGNYDITYVYGTLTITPREISVTTWNSIKVYDGMPLFNANVTFIHVKSNSETAAFVAGHKYTLSTPVEIIHVWESIEHNNKRTVTSIVDEENNDVGDNYSVSYSYGTLTITPCPLNITTGSLTVTYDDEWHSQTVAESVDSLALECQELRAIEDTVTKVRDAESVANTTQYTVYDTDLSLDVTDDYSISYSDYGVITVTKRDLLITTKSYEKEYDGTELSGWYDKAEGLIEGHTLAQYDSYAGKITDVGERKNEAKYQVFRSTTGKVTDNYNITYVYGTMKITPRHISIQQGSYEWTYDGKAHCADGTALTLTHVKADGTYIDDKALVGNHCVQAVSDPVYITEVGSKTFKYTYAIWGENAEWRNGGWVWNDIDVADWQEHINNNYVIVSIEDGTLTVLERNVCVVTPDGMWEYDGEEHSNCEVDRLTYLVDETYSGLADGHTAVVVEFATIINASTKENVLVIEIHDADGENVTSNYDIDYQYGTLTVTKRLIFVQTAGGKKMYDGTPLSAPRAQAYHIFVTSSGNLLYGEALVLGHTLLLISDPVSITDVGSVDNVLEFTVVGDGAEGNYDLRYEMTNNEGRVRSYGKLIVEPRKIAICTDSAAKVYDGMPLSATNVIIEYRGWITTSEREYKPFVSGHSYTLSDPVEIIHVWESAEHNNARYILTIIDVDGNDMMQNYEIVEDFGTLTIVPRCVYIAVTIRDKVYDGTSEIRRVPTWEYVGDSLVDDECIFLDGIEPNFVYTFWQGETEVQPIDAGTYIVKVTASTDSDDYVISVQDGTYTIDQRTLAVSTATETWEYDGEAHYNTTIRYGAYNYLLLEEHMFVASDYPVVRDVTDGVINKFTIKIYTLDGKTDVTANYRFGAIGYGKLVVTPRYISIQQGDYEWVYDGKTHSADGSEMKLVHVTADGTKIDDQALVGNHRVQAVSDPVYITDVGTETYKYAYVVLDENEEWAWNDGSVWGDDAIGTWNGKVNNNYVIVNVEEGTLTVTKRSICIVTPDGTWEYDGEMHSAYDIDSSTIDLADGHTAVVTQYTFITNASTRENVLEVFIYDADNVNVTDNYDVAYVYGTLTVTKRLILITTRSAEKEYDGTPLSATALVQHVHGTEGDYALDTAKVLVPGHTLSRVGDLVSITDVGWIYNIQEFTVIGEGAEGNYDIRYTLTIGGVEWTYGKLTVTPRIIKISTGSDSKPYDGTPLSNSDVTIVHEKSSLQESAFIAGHEYTLSEPVSFTHVSETKGASNNNTRTLLTVVDADGNDVSANYEVVEDFGTLTITPRDVYIQITAKSKTYDGTADILTPHTWEYVGDSLDGDEHVFVGEYEPTLVYTYWIGETEAQPIDAATYTIKAAVGADSDDYNISVQDGTYIIGRRGIMYMTATDTWEYDGENHHNATVVVHEKSHDTLVEGHVFVVEDYTVVCNVITDRANVVTVKVFASDGVTDVTENYVFRWVLGKLTVTPRYIHAQVYSYNGVYDGKSHSNTGAYVTHVTADGEYIDDIGLIGAHYLRPISATVSIRDVGSIENIYEYEVAGSMEGVNANYVLTVQSGTLTVTVRKVHIVTPTQSWEYDGQAHSSIDPDDFQYVVDETHYDLAEGHVAVVQDDYTTVREVTQYMVSNQFTVKICDAYGTAVNPANYEISYDYGRLAVTRRNVIVYTGSQTWIYDGESHSNSDVRIVHTECNAASDALVLDHQYQQVSPVPSVTHVTDTADNNNVFDVTIVDENGQDVSHSYAIEYVYGTLAVTPREVYIAVTPYVEKIYDAVAYTTTPDWQYVGLSATQDSDNIFLDGETPDFDFGYYLDGTAVTPVNAGTYAVKAEPSQTLYDYHVNADEGVLTIHKRKVKVSTASRNKTYDGEALESIDDDVTVSGVEGEEESGLVAGHVWEIQFGASIYRAGETANEVHLTVYANQADKATGKNHITFNYEFVDPEYGTLEVYQRGVFIIAADAERVYDGTSDLPTPAWEYTSISATNERFQFVEGDSIKFTYRYLQDGKEITPVHAGTYTIEMTAGPVMDIPDDDYYNYFITSWERDATLTITPREVTLIAPSMVDTYAKTAVAVDESAWNSVYFDNMQAGVAYEDRGMFSLAYAYYDENGVLLSSAPVNAGTYAVRIVPESITVTGTAYDDYIVTGTIDGQIIIVRKTIHIRIESGAKDYDGKPVYAKDCAYTLLDEAIEGDTLHLDGMTFAGQYIGGTDDVVALGAESVTDAGRYRLSLSREQFEANNPNYTIPEGVFGEYEIYKLKITVQNPDVTAIYDGTPVSTYSTYNADNLVAGHSIDATPFTQTDAGTYYYTSNIRIVDAYGNSMTHNYDIVEKAGKLVIEKRKISVTIGNSATTRKTYDGKPFTVRDADLTVTNLVEGHTVSSASWKIRQGGEWVDIVSAGVYNSYVAGFIVKEGNKTVTDNYEISLECVPLTIEQVRLFFSVRDKEKEFDGEGITLTAQEYLQGAVPTGVALSGESQTALKNCVHAGDYNVTVNKADITIDGKAYSDGYVEENGNEIYDFDYIVVGDDAYTIAVKITKYNLNSHVGITTLSNAWMYDGKAHQEVKNVMTGDGIPVGYEFAVTSAPSVTLPGESMSNNLTFIIREIATGKDVSNTDFNLDNFTKYTYGVISIIKDVTPAPDDEALSNNGQIYYDGTDQLTTGDSITGRVMAAKQSANSVLTFGGTVAKIERRTEGDNYVGVDSVRDAGEYRVYYTPGAMFVSGNPIDETVVALFTFSEDKKSGEYYYFDYTVQKLRLFVRAQDMSWTYNGVDEVAHNGKYDIIGQSDTLMGNDTLVVTVDGKWTSVTTTAQVAVSDAWVESNGSVSGNYNVYYEYEDWMKNAGLRRTDFTAKMKATQVVLYVTPKAPSDNVFIYNNAAPKVEIAGDGSELYVIEDESVLQYVVDGNTVQHSVYVRSTQATSTTTGAKKWLQVGVRNAIGQDVSNMYKVQYLYGDDNTYLHIVEARLTLDADTESKTVTVSLSGDLVPTRIEDVAGDAVVYALTPTYAIRIWWEGDTVEYAFVRNSDGYDKETSTPTKYFEVTRTYNGIPEEVVR